MRANIGTWEFSDRERQVIARALGTRGLASRTQCCEYVARCFAGTLERHEADMQREASLAWRRGQPELTAAQRA